MKNVENLNAPSLAGWAMAFAAGLVAFAVAKVIGGFDFMPSAFFGVLVMLAAGLVMGMPWGASVPAAQAADAVAPKAEAAAPVKAAAVADVAAVAAKPAPAAKAAAPAAAKVEKAAAPAKAEKAAPAAKAEKAVAVKAEAAPKAAAPVADVPAAVGEGTKPKALKAPRKGAADDLKAIEGIGPALEKLCHGLGIYHFDQIAGWGEAEVAWMDTNLKGFKGRVTRDKWVAQAKLIGEVGMDEFLRRAKTNDY